MIRHVVLYSILAGAPALAQNTSSLGARGARPSFQLAGGTSVLPGSPSAQRGLEAFNAAYQSRARDRVAFRTDVWFFRREETLMSDLTTTSSVWAIGLSGSYHVRFTRHATVELSLGGGLVPFARSRTVYRPPPEYGQPGESETTAGGAFWSPGATLRVWHFVAQVHAIQVMSSNAILISGAVAPFTVGVRF